MSYAVKKLPYAYDFLEPFIDQKTTEIHHDKHYAGYVDKLNIALENQPDLAKRSIEELLKDIDSVPDEIRIPVVNNGGGAVNHEMFWDLLGKSQAIGGDLAEAINKKFGSFEDFKKQFSEVATKFFGSGWAWLVMDNKQLEIITTMGHDSPLTNNQSPILVLDLWEHAYYLKYQNRRPEYIEAWWQIIDWDKVNQYYQSAIKK